MQNNLSIHCQSINPLVRPTIDQTFEECWNELTELCYDFKRLDIAYASNIIDAIQGILLQKNSLNCKSLSGPIMVLVWKLRNYLTMLQSHGSVDAHILTRVANLNGALYIALGYTLQ